MFEEFLTCQRFTPPLDTIQSFSRIAASKTDTLKLDGLHEESGVDIDDK